MKLFIKRILAFCLALSVFFSCLILFNIFIIGNRYTETYQAMLLDKFERAESVNKPKIILVGNSNVVFGFDSERIEKEMRMPVVNMGLHGGLGNAFLEEYSKSIIKKCDIVIVSHLSYDDDDKIPDPSLAWITLEWHKNLWKSSVRLKDLPCLLQAYPQYFLRTFKLWSHITKELDDGSVYRRNTGNKYGDILIDEPCKIDFSQSGVNIPAVGDTCVKRLNELNSFVKEKGAVLLVASYPIAYGEYTPDKENYLNFEKDLKSRLECDVISDFSDHFIPYDFFYDTQFHLTGKGAEIHTEQVIKELKQWYSENKQNNN